MRGADLFHGAHNILPHHVPCPSVVTIHDLLPIEYPRLAFRRWEEIPKRVYFVQAQWRALRQATRLIVTTNAMADRVRRLCPEASRRVDVIPLGVGQEFRPPDNRAAVRRRVTELVGFDAPYFLVVGQYAPNKRHDLALAAFADRVPEPWRLIFVQRQTRHAPLADLAEKLGVAERVSWFPYLELGDLIQLYQAASGLVQPSLYEGFGIPLLEAMACGCPVVATDMPMFREVLGPAGLLVGKNGNDGFGHALASLVKSEAWRSEVSEAGIERAAQFSWDRCAESTLHVLRNAAGGVASSTTRIHAAV